MATGMNGPGSAQFRPMEIGEILDRSFRMFRAAWKPLVIVGLIGTVPGVISGIGGLMLVGGVSSSDPTRSLLFRVAMQAQGGDFSQVLALGGVYLLMALAAMLFYPLVQGAVIAICSRAFLGQPTDAGMALRISLRRYPALLGTMFLLGLTYLVAIPLLAIAGLVILAILTIPAGLVALSVYFAFTNHAVVVEQAGGGVPAMTRSFKLVGGRFWPLLGLGIIFTLMMSVVGGMIGFVFNLPLSIAGAITQNFTLSMIGALVTSLVTAVTMPFKLVGLTLAYYDTRMRKEGFDLELLAQSRAVNPDPTSGGL
jgi:hypothetical protein